MKGKDKESAGVKVKNASDVQCRGAGMPPNKRQFFEGSSNKGGFVMNKRFLEILRQDKCRPTQPGQDGNLTLLSMK